MATSTVAGFGVPTQLSSVQRGVSRFQGGRLIAFERSPHGCEPIVIIDAEASPYRLDREWNWQLVPLGTDPAARRILAASSLFLLIA